MKGSELDFPRPAAAIPAPPPARILVAEDDAPMRLVVVETLRKDGYEVTEAADGGRLLVTLARHYGGSEGVELVDLIVSDVRMPVCSGLQIVQQLRAIRCRIPVILVTAFGDDETRRQAQTLHALLLDKPFEMGDLKRHVARLLRPTG